MSVNFNDETWKYVETEIVKGIENMKSVCTNADKSYKEVLVAQGAIQALKTILNLPQAAKALAATPKRL